MQLILDHLSTVIIGSMVALSLTASQVRMTQGRVEQVSAYVVKTKALSLADWLERDVVTLGKNLGQDNYRFEYPSYNAEGQTSEWVFWSDSTLTSTATTRYYTRYELTQVDSLELEPDAFGQQRYQPLYEARRYTAAMPVVGGTVSFPSARDWVGDGLTVRTLSSFTVQLLMNDGTVAASSERDEADFIRLQFAMIPELDPEQAYLSELFWTTTLKVRPFWEQYKTTTI
ncbi:MAG: hypothetical protein AAFQ53_08895 [Bacteroidota bacterium]